MTTSLSPPVIEPVLYEQDGPVAIITLNRPERHNAWNQRLEIAYHQALGRADNDPDIRALVLTGAGRSFCVGADLEDVSTAANGGAVEIETGERRTAAVRLRKPLIAAINGAAAGLGLMQALYCDVRFCAPDAKLTTAVARRGLIAEYGLAWLLPRLVGSGRASDLLLSGRTLSGAEAHRIGLVEYLSAPADLLSDALAYARLLAENCSPESMRVIKRQLHAAASQDWRGALLDSDRLLAASLKHPDVAEGVKSYLERRPPAFNSLPSKEPDHGIHAD